MIIRAKTLEKTVTKIVSEKANTVVNQQNNNEAVTDLNANFQADKENIQTMKDEIEYLKKMVDMFFVK